MLDLGTGTGVLPRNMIRFGAKFTGVDISENQIAEARRLTRGLDGDIEYIVSSAEDINFPNNSFDVVTACQCYMYFNMQIILPKLYAILKEDGYFCILFMAWLPEESNIAKKSEELVLKYNPFWTGANMNRSAIHLPELIDTFFAVEDEIIFDVDISFTRQSWNGRIKACRGIGASNLSEQEIESFEREHMDFLNSVEGEFIIPHTVTLINLKKRKIE